MILLFILLLIAAGFSYGLVLVIPLELMFSIPIAIVCSLIGTFLLFILAVLFIILPIFNLTSPKGRFKHAIFRQVSDMIFLFGRTPYKVEGLENLIKESDEPLIIVSNHKSNMDGFWLHKVMKRPLSAVGKQELADNFLYGKIMKAYKIIAIDRENNRKAAVSINNAINLAKTGLPMLIFTEGGIKSRETGQMVTVRPGAYKLAYKAEANIQVLALHNSNTIKTRKFMKKVNIVVKVLPPIMYNDYKDLTTTELGLKIASMVNSTFDEEQVKVEVL